ncbi:hypothetical protein [Primorskyibacter sp. 2E233]|uniref:hypothetical protein n=1 Tax=Primorskyibacter sp. 2E233 TaxID=3413431 RepID=UPI003BF20883
MSTDQKTDPLELSVGFFTRAQDFATSAKHLCEVKLKLCTDAPQHLLLAHALELVLKAYLLALGEKVTYVEAYEHDLKTLYDAVGQKVPDVIKTAEKNVRRKWITELREKRDLTFGSSAESGMPGYISNEDIGSQAPDPMADLEWLSKRHKFKGSIFRYYKPTFDTVRIVKFPGSSVETPFRSNLWLVEDLVASFPRPVLRNGKWHMTSRSTI